jgi:hypothetical protein
VTLLAERKRPNDPPRSLRVLIVDDHLLDAEAAS